MRANSSQIAASNSVEADIPPATARLAMNYRAPIDTPGIVLARATVSKVEGRKVAVMATLEDGKGGVFADAEVLYIIARPKI
jgi:acyl-coenzyme A thioesterase THEM4